MNFEFEPMYTGRLAMHGKIARAEGFAYGVVDYVRTDSFFHEKFQLSFMEYDFFISKARFLVESPEHRVRLFDYANQNSFDVVSVDEKLTDELAWKLMEKYLYLLPGKISGDDVRDIRTNKRPDVERETFVPYLFMADFLLYNAMDTLDQLLNYDAKYDGKYDAKYDEHAAPLREVAELFADAIIAYPEVKRIQSRLSGMGVECQQLYEQAWNYIQATIRSRPNAEKFRTRMVKDLGSQLRQVFSSEPEWFVARTADI